MKQAGTIVLPASFRKVGEVRGRIAVEHAALDVRAGDCVLAFALATEGDVLIAGRNFERIRLRALEWCNGLAPKRCSAAGFFGLRFRDRVVWIAGVRAKWGDAPFSRLAGAFIADAHFTSTNPLDSVPGFQAGTVLIAGEFSPRDHWFYSWARQAKTRLVRIPAKDVVRDFPDQASRVTTKNARGHARAFALEDVLEPPVPFVRFARTRLRVLTDKGTEYLATEQQAEARRQYGEDWEGAGVPVVSMRVTPAQRRVLAIKRHARALGFRRFLLLKYRRGGFTTLFQALSYYVAVTQPRSQLVTLAHVRDSANRIFRMVTEFHRRDSEAPPNLSDSRTTLAFPNGSLFITGTARGAGFARGEMFRRIHGSEVSRWGKGPRSIENVKDLVASITEAAGRDGEVDFETTPNGLEWFCQTYREAKQRWSYLLQHGSRSERSTAWWPIFMRWFDDPANSARVGTFDPEEVVATLTEEERALVTRYGLAPAQIAFRRAQKQALGALFAQEYPEDDDTCFLTTGLCFFDVSTILALMAEAPAAPVRVERVEGGTLTYWEEPDPTKKTAYGIGVDTSEGLPGRDPNGVGVLAGGTGGGPDRQAALAYGYFKPHVLAALTKRLSQEFGRALYGVEREQGQPVLQELRTLRYVRPHYLGGPCFHFAKDRAGWSTNESTRQQLLHGLARALDDGAILVRDRKMLEEALTFRLQRAGRWEHDPGAHDDTLFIWGIAREVLHVPRRKPRMIGAV